MTTTQYIALRKKLAPIQFKYEMLLKADADRINLLTAFCSKAHPTAASTVKNNTCHIHTGTFGIMYSVYTTGILRNNLSREKKDFFSF